MKKTLFLVTLSLLHTTNIVMSSQQLSQNSQSTQSTDISLLFPLHTQNSQTGIQSYHTSQQDAQVNDGYGSDDISSLLHQPTPPISQLTELDEDDISLPIQARQVAIVSQEVYPSHTIHRTYHVHQQYNHNGHRVNVVTQETDIAPQAHIVYALVSQETQAALQDQ